MKTLEILIPTHKRPESAAQAIESCLASKDKRLSVICNSNGYESSLDKYRNYDERLIYSYFDSNCGVHANILYLMLNTNARFCMLLSDEDRIDQFAVTKFLDFLDQCPASVKVVTCSVFDPQSNNYIILPNRQLAHVDLDLNGVLAFSAISTYMSGLVFSVDGLGNINLKELLAPSQGNAYPHLDVAYNLLTDGLLRSYVPRFVLKGVDVTIGGDGYSHRMSCQPKRSGNADLNPFVYGPKARVRQFYYLENRLSNIGKYMDAISYFMAKSNLFCFMERMVLKSNNTTVLEEGASIHSEAELAMIESKQNGEYSGSVTARLFLLVVRAPALTSNFIINVLGKVTGALHKFKILKITISRRIA